MMWTRRQDWPDMMDRASILMWKMLHDGMSSQDVARTSGLPGKQSILTTVVMYIALIQIAEIVAEKKFLFVLVRALSYETLSSSTQTFPDHWPILYVTCSFLLVLLLMLYTLMIHNVA